jgi:hypothetical protein
MEATMATRIQIKVAIVVALMAAALVGRPESPRWLTLGVIAFGAFNVLLDAPGTESIRAVATGGTFAALLLPNWFFGPVALIAWFVWVPAFAVAWALARNPRHEASEGARARIALATLIVAVAISSIAYRIIVGHNLQQTAALFIGIPALLAIVVVFGVSPESATGVACKAVTIVLLVSLVFIWEGMLCVLMSAPIFFAVAIGVARLVQYARNSNDTTTVTLRSCLILLAIVPMSLEGVTEFTTVNREESVAASQIVVASPEAVERALFEIPRFNRVRPLHLRAGFPSPVATRIERNAGETRWVIQMRGGEMLLTGVEPGTGDLTLELEEARPGLVRWRAISDTSHMTHFLMWREIVVQWQAVDASTTRVTWTLRYLRGLDPAWYFGPMERYAARLAAGYLIDSVATP